LALPVSPQIVARGPWSRVLSEAGDAFALGDHELALLRYLRASELGLEVAQSNAAWMLERGLGRAGARGGRLALQLSHRAAEQGNHAALLSMGDAFYYGRCVKWARFSGVGFC
jgi:SEL1 protein